jgi:hypothetical protein
MLFSRRAMLAQCSTGFGMVALAGLMQQAGLAAPGIDGAGPDGGKNDPLAPAARRPHFKPRAKNVIFCFMSGGVSQVDSFDPKPALDKLAGQPLPGPIERTQFNNNGNVMPSPWAFKKYGQCGMPVSDIFTHIGSCADDLAVVRSMTAKFSEHAQGNYFMHTGFPFLGYPTAGAWINYGLGCESQNLPGFVVLHAGGSGVPHGGVGLYGSGFLPANNQASVVYADAEEPIRNIRPREALAVQRRRLALIDQLDRRYAQSTHGDPQVEAAIANYEQAFRMQAGVPQVVDISGETAATHKLYGLDSEDSQTAAYGRQCLLARRLVERGVRFVELSCLTRNIGAGQAPNPWDQHSELKKGHEKMAQQVDQPIAGLLKDLKSRGLLDETLVVWAGEFGRTPFSQGSNGRDHDPFGFSIWLAGGGIRGGTIYGATDEFGYRAVENISTVYDLWATVLHQLGLDHEALTYRYGGRDFRLTDVHGHVWSSLLA